MLTYSSRGDDLPVELQYLAKPSNKSQNKKHIVIVGGGIIGACTAYYFTKHPKFNASDYHVTLLESVEVAGGASGKAGGLLASWAFPEEIVPLSFQLHQDLSDEYNGEVNWGYRRLNTLSLEADLAYADNGQLLEKVYDLKVPAPKKKNKVDLNTTNSESGSGSSSEDHEDGDNTDNDNSLLEINVSSHNLPKDVTWINRNLISEWSSLGGTDSTAQVHPYQFTTFIMSKAMESGAVDLVLGKLNKINLDSEGVANSLTFIPTSPDIELKEPIEIKNIHKTVLTMGPWISKILLDCPISGLRAHSIVIQPNSERKKSSITNSLSPYALFTEIRLPDNQFFSPEFYARKDELYICGEGDTFIELPDTLDEVSVTTEKCDELLNYASKILSKNILENGPVIKKQVCYLPVLNVPTSSGPLIGETNVKDLIVASGHSCWGINNAPATGKVVSEIILEGNSTSADISKLDPTLFFDASRLD